MRMPTRHDLVSAFRAATEAADPFRAVEAVLAYENGDVSVAGSVVGQFQPDQISVVGLGKAGPAMADAVAAVTGSTTGIVVSPYDSPCSVPAIRGGHPIPTQASLDAGRAIEGLVSGCPADGLIIAVVSGGGSAAADVLVDGVTLEDLAEVNALLLESGSPIAEINEVRAAISQMKAGGVSDWAGETQIVTLVLSDVVAGGPEFVSSGPTIPSALGVNANRVLDALEAGGRVPDAVRSAASSFVRRRSQRPLVVETVGSAVMATAAAAKYLAAQGFDVRVATSELTGEARDKAREVLTTYEGGVVWVAAGEPTVTVTGPGVGGRSQEAALAAVPMLSESGGIFAAIGTDGIDGPTEAAGAVVDGSTARDLAHGGWDVSAELAANNSHPVLSNVGATVVTGPTGTNVGDVWMWATPPAL